MQEHRALRSIPSMQKSNTSDIGFVKHLPFRFWRALETQRNIVHISHICLNYISNKFTPQAKNECHVIQAPKSANLLGVNVQIICLADLSYQSSVY